MMRWAEQHDRRLVEAYCHGEASAAQLRELSDRLAADAAMRMHFLEAMDIHAALRWKMTAEPDRVQGSGFRGQESTPANRSPQFAIGLALAAAVALAVTAWFVFVPEPRTPTPGVSPAPAAAPSVAVMTDTKGVVWGTEPMVSGQELAAGRGRIAIAGGTLELSLMDRATMWISGPAEFNMVGETAVALHRGRLQVRSNPGFTVQLSGGVRIVDLGTEFGVVVREDGPAELWVSQGRVRIETLNASGRWVALRTIAAGDVDADGGEALPVRVVSTMPSLVGLWRFDDRTMPGLGFGRVRIQLAARGEPGYTADGRFGGALTLDGVEDCLAAEAFPEMVPAGNDPYTIAAWIAPAGSGRRGILGWGEYERDNAVTALRLTDAVDPQKPGGLLHYWWGDDLGVSAAEAKVDLADGWHHVAATWDGRHRRLWIDGVMVAADEPAAHAAAATTLAIGRTNPSTPHGSEYFAGRLDDVAIFDRALEAEQLRAVMNGQFCAGSHGAAADSRSTQSLR